MGSSIWKVEPLPSVEFDPDAAAMHLDDLLGDGEPEPGAALGLGVGAVDLMELLEDARLLFGGMPGPVSVTLTAKWPFAALAVTRTSPASVNLMALPTRLSSTWVRRCSSPRPIGRRLGNLGLERELLGLRQRLGCRPHCLDHALDRILGEVQAELAGLDLGDVEHGVDQARAGACRWSGCA